MLLARLGLRAAEVAAVELDDVDWRAGELIVRGKGRRGDRLPLPADVGQAVVDYLKHRPTTTGCRVLFVTRQAPLRPMHPNTISRVVRFACHRAGMQPVTAHRLRHALATELLDQEANLVEIAAVLRHRDLATTATYAKVNRAALGMVAAPWPGAER
jgi:site-specific recombinase XerD